MIQHQRGNESRTSSVVSPSRKHSRIFLTGLSSGLEAFIRILWSEDEIMCTWGMRMIGWKKSLSQIEFTEIDDDTSDVNAPFFRKFHSEQYNTGHNLDSGNPRLSNATAYSHLLTKFKPAVDHRLVIILRRTIFCRSPEDINQGVINHFNSCPRLCSHLIPPNCTFTFLTNNNTPCYHLSSWVT